jgi:ADP-heptose:LPS heptosyltransferase
VIRAGALGDILLALPALRALREKIGPTGRLELVGYPTVLQLASHALRVDAIHSIDRALFSGLFSEPNSPELGDLLASFDLVVAWCRDPSGRLASRLAGSRAYLRADPYPPPGTGVHASNHLLRSLRSLEVSWPQDSAVLELPEVAVAASQAWLRGAGLESRGFLAIHPGSGSARKNWPPERFARLIALARRADRPVLVIEGEADQESVQRLYRRLPWRPPVARGLDLAVLAALLSRAGAFIGNDSGVSHLAAATGAPTVALFGATDPARWAPRGRRVVILHLRANPHSVWEKLGELADW